MAQLELFFDIKNKQHNASGVKNPHLQYWAKDSSTNEVFYPVKEIDEDEYHHIVREWMEEVGLPPLSLDEHDSDRLTEEQKTKYYWLLDLFDMLRD